MSPSQKQKPIQYTIKRAADYTIAVFAIIFLSPILLIIACLVLIFHGRPLLFRQQRPGLHGRTFNMWKFRTMRNTVGGDGELLSDQERVTRFGTFLRSTSLDELPELFNVLRSEMTIVGPRPLLIEYLPRYTAEQNRRHDVLPGITGWAQVNGRQSISLARRIDYDLYYVDNWSLFFDVKVLLATVGCVIRRRSTHVYAEDDLRTATDTDDLNKENKD
jgi:sugar transferase EpsL